MKTHTFIDNEEQLVNHRKIKTMTITVELYENLTVEQMENIIEYALNEDRVDCTFNVEENSK